MGAEERDTNGNCWICGKGDEHCYCWDRIGREYNKRHRARTGRWFSDHDPLKRGVCFDEYRDAIAEAKATRGKGDIRLVNKQLVEN